jgi:hypothetical protein
MQMPSDEVAAPTPSPWLGRPTRCRSAKQRGELGAPGRRLPVVTQDEDFDGMAQAHAHLVVSRV